jgi:hypothetical protein
MLRGGRTVCCVAVERFAANVTAFHLLIHIILLYYISLVQPDNKTTGNPFFVIFFLRSLYDDELLEYNFGRGAWLWDDKKIDEKLMTENVASMMVNKLRRMKMTAQHIIKV